MIRYRRSSSCKRCRLGETNWLCLRRNQSLRALGIVRCHHWNLKKLTEGHHKEWIVRLNLTQRGTTYQDRTGWDCCTELCLKIPVKVVHGRFQHVAWAVWLIPTTRETPSAIPCVVGRIAASYRKRGDNRSVMPLDVLGCTRNTIGVRKLYQRWYC